jgi:WD40 repeat protein
MSTVRAPYPSDMDEIHGQSVISMNRSGGTVTFTNRAGEIVASLPIRNDPAKFAKAIRRIGSFDSDYKDVVVRGFYHPLLSPTAVTGTYNAPPGQVAYSCISWSPDANYIAAAHGVTPFFSVWKREPTYANDFTKLANPAALPASSCTAAAWSQDGKHLFVGIGATSPYLYAYSRTGDVLTQVASGAGVCTPLPATTISGLRLSRDGWYLCVVQASGAPYFNLFKRSSLTSPLFNQIVHGIAFQAGNAFDAAWTQDAKYLAAARSAGGSPPYLYILKRTGDTFVNLNQPSVMPNGACLGVSFSLDDNYLAVTDNIPRLYVYSRSGDTFTRVAATSTGAGGDPPGTPWAVDWSPDGKCLSVSHGSNPCVSLYKFENNVLTRVQSGLGVAGANGFDTRFSPDGRNWAVGSNASPYLNIFRSPNIPISGPAIRIDPNAPVLQAGAGGPQPV